MMHVQSPTGAVIHTDSCKEIDRILEEEGKFWFNALNPNEPLQISEKAFQRIDALVSRK